MKAKSVKLAALAFAMALVACLALVGCGGSEKTESSASSSASSEASSSSAESSASSEGVESDVTLQIYAANSLEKAMNAAQELYTDQTGVKFADTQYLASGDINAKLEAGAESDIEITASKSTMDDAVDAGYVDESTRIDMFSNELVIIAKKGSGYGDITLEDIAKGEYTLCVGDDSVPAGNYAAQALSTVGAFEGLGSDEGKTGAEISGKTNTDGNPTGRYVGITPTTVSKVGDVATTVASGEVDLGIVYSSDAYRFDGVEIVSIIPDDAHKPIVYPGAVCKDAKNADEAAEFIEWCITDPDAQKIWNEWGFELSQD